MIVSCTTSIKIRLVLSDVSDMKRSWSQRDLPHLVRVREAAADRNTIELLLGNIVQETTRAYNWRDRIVSVLRT